MAEDEISTARIIYDAYVESDRAKIEAVLAHDFHFTSPVDNRIDRETYMRTCWPNHETSRGFDFIHLVEDGERVFVTYEAIGSKGRFRNTEIVTVRDARIVEIEVYFGWSVPHKASPGDFLQDDSASTQVP